MTQHQQEQGYCQTNPIVSVMFVLSAVTRETAPAGPGLLQDKSKCFGVVFAVLSAVASDSEPLEEGLNGVDLQPSNGLKFNRKPLTVKNLG